MANAPILSIQNYIELCGVLNNDLSKIAEVTRGVKEKLRSDDPNRHIQALFLVDVMVKNCGQAVHSEIAQENIPWEIMTLVRRPIAPHVRDKALEFINSWKDKFGGPSSQFPQFFIAFNELRNAGFLTPVKRPQHTMLNPATIQQQQSTFTSSPTFGFNPPVPISGTPSAVRPQGTSINVPTSQTQMNAPATATPGSTQVPLGAGGARQLTPEQAILRLKSIREVVKRYHQELQAKQNWRLQKLAEGDEVEQEMRDSALDRYNRNAALLETLFTHDTEFTLQNSADSSAVSDRAEIGLFCRDFSSKWGSLKLSMPEREEGEKDNFSAGQLKARFKKRRKEAIEEEKSSEQQMATFDLLMASVPTRIESLEEFEECSSAFERGMGRSVKGFFWASECEVLEGSSMAESLEKEVLGDSWQPVDLGSGWKKVPVRKNDGLDSSLARIVSTELELEQL